MNNLSNYKTHAEKKGQWNSGTWLTASAASTDLCQMIIFWTSASQFRPMHGSVLVYACSNSPNQPTNKQPRSGSSQLRRKRKWRPHLISTGSPTSSVPVSLTPARARTSIIKDKDVRTGKRARMDSDVHLSFLDESIGNPSKKSV